MNLIPFVKSNSPSITTTRQSDEAINPTLAPCNTTDEENVGRRVAEIYQSIVALKTTTKSTSSTIQPDSSTKDAISRTVGNKLDSPLYCQSCEMVVRDPGHFRGTAHLVSTSIPQQHDAPRKSTKKTMITRLELEHGKDSAMHLMEKYGWRPGEGLGKSKQGTPYPVTTVWKQDRLGIGHPRTDRRRITHPSINKTTKNTNNMSSGSVSGKKLAADAKAEAALRSAMLNYMNH